MQTLLPPLPHLRMKIIPHRALPAPQNPSTAAPRHPFARPFNPPGQCPTMVACPLSFNHSPSRPDRQQDHPFLPRKLRHHLHRLHHHNLQLLDIRPPLNRSTLPLASHHSHLLAPPRHKLFPTLLIYQLHRKWPPNSLL